MSEMISESYLPEDVITNVEDVDPVTDLIVVLGKNKGQMWDMDRLLKTPDYLSQDSQLNALAAGFLWNHLARGRAEDDAPDIVFSGGMKLPVPAGVDDRDDWFQGDAAARYMMRKYPDIPKEHVIAETTGYSTPKAAEAIAEMVDARGYGAIALLTVGYHQAYAPVSFRQYGLTVSPVASEDILAQRSPAFGRFIDENWRNKERIQAEIAYSRTKLVEVQTVDFRGAKSDERTRLRALGLNEEAPTEGQR